MNEGLMITTLGNLALQIGEEKVKGFTSRKAEALLVYLAVEKNTTHRRERLFTLLWPELPESSAQQLARSAVLFAPGYSRSRNYSRPG